MSHNNCVDISTLLHAFHIITCLYFLSFYLWIYIYWILFADIVKEEDIIIHVTFNL